MSDKRKPSKRMTGGEPTGSRRRRVTKPAEANAENQRTMTKKVKTARGRKLSSKLWLERQINDPYVMRAQAEGWRSRAAFKLIELDEKYRLIKPNALIADLGSAPGGWSQVAMKRGAKRVVGIDLLPVAPVVGTEQILMDFTDPDAADLVMELLGGKPDLVMSDLAANTTGHQQTDHLRTVALVEAAAEFAFENLNPGGHFIAKVFQGGTEGKLLQRLKNSYEMVRHAKPNSSRKGSPEIYLLAKGFKG